MNISFKVTNTNNSIIELKIDGRVSQSEFVNKDEQVEFVLSDEQVKTSKSITIENSDIVYDITQSCKDQVLNYKKPVVELCSISLEHRDKKDKDYPITLKNSVPITGHIRENNSQSGLKISSDLEVDDL